MSERLNQFDTGGNCPPDNSETMGYVWGLALDVQDLTRWFAQRRQLSRRIHWIKRLASVDAPVDSGLAAESERLEELLYLQVFLQSAATRFAARAERETPALTDHQAPREAVPDNQPRSAPAEWTDIPEAIARKARLMVENGRLDPAFLDAVNGIYGSFVEVNGHLLDSCLAGTLARTVCDFDGEDEDNPTGMRVAILMCMPPPWHSLHSASTEILSSRDQEVAKTLAAMNGALADLARQWAGAIAKRIESEVAAQGWTRGRCHCRTRTRPSVGTHATARWRPTRLRSGTMFARLWDGDLAHHGDGSAADLALCSILAFWAGPSPPASTACSATRSCIARSGTSDTPATAAPTDR